MAPTPGPCDSHAAWPRSLSAVLFHLAQECSGHWAQCLPWDGTLTSLPAQRLLPGQGLWGDGLHPYSSRQGRPACWVTLGLLHNLSGPLKNRCLQSGGPCVLLLGRAPLAHLLEPGFSLSLAVHALASPHPPTSPRWSPDFAPSAVKISARTGRLPTRMMGTQAQRPPPAAQSCCPLPIGGREWVPGVVRPSGLLPLFSEYSAFSQSSFSSCRKILPNVAPPREVWDARLCLALDRAGTSTPAASQDLG